MRHPKEGAPIVAARHSSVPVINAGDGGHYHPTQTLTDLLTIRREKGRFDNLKIGLCGDLKFGRTVHSLIGAMSRYQGIEFVLISPEELKLPGFVKQEYIKKKNIPYTQKTSLDEVNVSNFAEYVKRYSEDTQFILITHRKGSMEVCNALYGVAMEERGISKIVSARFNEIA